MRRWSVRLSVSFGLLAVAACTHAPPEAVDLRPLPVRPGTGLGGQRVIVLPVSMIRHGDTFGLAEQITNPREYLVDLNAKIERGLTERAPRTVWLFPTALVQVASRNPGYLSDPYGMDPSQFAPDRWRPGVKLEDPLAGQLRNFTSFVDARVALLLVELRFVPRPMPRGHALPQGERAMLVADSANHMARAVMRIAVVDTRTTEVIWTGDVVGDPARALTPAIGTNLVDRLVQALATE
jgi:hypothetical protein